MPAERRNVLFEFSDVNSAANPCVKSCCSSYSCCLGCADDGIDNLDRICCFLIAVVEGVSESVFFLTKSKGFDDEGKFCP